MKEYTVTINGLEHTMLLEEEDQKHRVPTAKATDDKSEAESKEADKPANKSGTAANK